MMHTFRGQSRIWTGRTHLEVRVKYGHDAHI